jgi:hypothetical protein
MRPASTLTHVRQSSRLRVADLLVVGLVWLATPACTARPALTQLVEARRLASELHVEFTKAADAANRAVMADTDEASAAAVGEARGAKQIVEQNVEALQSILESLGYGDDLRYLEGFKTRYQEYQRLDDEILPLAVENTNVKAQRLSFGPAREAADAFRSTLDRALKAGGARDPWKSEALAARAESALLQIQVLHAPHIAEADLAAMTRMEEQMARSETNARTAVQQLKPALPPSAAPHLADAIAALDRFHGINKELIALSRRNSDVRSLALSLGRKRVVTAECEDQLRALEEALAKHEFTATR